LNSIQRIIISRNDNLGDVILTLPIAGILKRFFPDVKIIFLGKKYTKPIIDTSINIDDFVDWDELRKMPEEDALSIFKNYKADAIIHVFPSAAAICKGPVLAATRPSAWLIKLINSDKFILPVRSTT